MVPKPGNINNPINKEIINKVTHTYGAACDYMLGSYIAPEKIISL